MTPRESLFHLATAVNHSGYDDAVRDLYLSEISGYDSRDVEAACKTLGRTSQWWPKLVELRTAIHEARTARVTVTRGADSLAKTHACRLCGDAKWLLLDCSGPPARECGRGEKGRTIVVQSGDGKKRDVYVGSCQYAHVYSKRCSCHPSAAHNPLQPATTA